MKPSATLSPGRPHPVPTEEAAVFWQGAAKGRLILRRCEACDRAVPPLSPRCPGCLSDNLSPHQYSNRATLKGRTVLHIPGYPGQAVPTTLAECALEEDPGIVLIASDPEDITASLAPGDPVIVGFHTDADGTLALVRSGSA